MVNIERALRFIFIINVHLPVPEIHCLNCGGVIHFFCVKNYYSWAQQQVLCRSNQPIKSICCFHLPPSFGAVISAALSHLFPCLVLKEAWKKKNPPQLMWFERLMFGSHLLCCRNQKNSKNIYFWVLGFRIIRLLLKPFVFVPIKFIAYLFPPLHKKHTLSLHFQSGIFLHYNY